MERASQIFEWVQLVIYVALGLVSILAWVRKRRAPEAWVAITFGILGTISLLGQFLPEEASQIPDLELRVLLAVLVMFPYSMFRFTETFGRASRPWGWAAAILTAAAGALPFFISDFADRIQQREGLVLAWILLLIGQWFVLFMYSAARLIRGARRQPRIVRLRMKTIATGLIGIAVILLVSGAAPQEDPNEVTGLSLATQVIGVIAAPLFFLGFAPPRFVVWLWRRKDEERLRAAEASLLGSRSTAETGAVLLPLAVELVGGSAGLLQDVDGNDISAYGDTSTFAASVTPQHGDRISIRGDNLILTVHTSTYAPYFGQEELHILQSLASLTDLALERSKLLEEQATMVDTLSASNQTMREFVAIASHDLRTPLTVIRGLVEALAEHWDRFDDASKREQLDAMRRQSHHLARLVEDLLTVSRIDAGAVEAEPREIDVSTLVQSAVEDFRRTGTDIVARVPEGLVARADPEHLVRMLFNYFENARIYGAPPITIEGRDAGRHVELRVTDEGPGVPAEFKSRMFEKFARADLRKSKAAQGTGLGLAIVRGLARASGGDAWYEDVPNGACFALRFPKHNGASP